MNIKKVAVIGGGAAGFFVSVNLAELNPGIDVVIYEASGRLLGKVEISGGGRCNVCNSETDPELLASHYPRGEAELRQLFRRFGTRETMDWFTQHGVELKTEADGRVFPSSNQSLTIINCFLDACKSLGVEIRQKSRLSSIKKLEGKWQLCFAEEKIICDYVVICTGGNRSVWDLLQTMQIPVSPTVPSLFTFRVKDGKMAHLSGVSVQDVSLSFQNEQFKGPILFTHRGLSGPVVLRTSAWLARELFEQDYKFDLKISWLTGKRRTELESEMLAYIESGSRLKVHQLKIEGIPKRLLNFLIEEAGVREYTNWAELGKKGVKAILSQLFEFSVAISGKDTFKDEFVTAGGVELKALNTNTFESLAYPGLYFAGEVLDIDGITGGFNFQASWSVSFMVAKAISDN